jgi:hypothetical protein
LRAGGPSRPPALPPALDPTFSSVPNIADLL